VNKEAGIAQLKARLREIGAILWSPAARQMSGEDRRALKQEEKDLLLEYAELLEHREISRCPICGTPLQVAMDTSGFDSPWWWTTAPMALPEHLACEHFRVFLGATDLGGRSPEEVTENVLLGPGKPFLIERLLAMEGMQAVLSSLTAAHGDRLYLVSYFSPEPVPPGELHQEYRKEKYPIRDEDGEIVFAESKFDRWDFDLERWAEAGALRWIEPDDATLVLRDGAPAPYLELSGTEQQQVAADGELELWEAPQGQDNAQYERP